MCTAKESIRALAETVLGEELASPQQEMASGWKKAYLETGGMRQNMSITWSDILKLWRCFNRSSVKNDGQRLDWILKKMLR